MTEQRGTDAATLTGQGMIMGARRLLPLTLVVVPFGFAFGAAGVERGLSAFEAMLMSALVFAGASQFATLELWTQPLPLLSIAVTVFAVNARHLLMGAALSPWVHPLPWYRSGPALVLMADVNFADAHRAFREGSRDVGILLGGGLFLWVIWVVGTAGGIALGNQLGNLQRFGLDLVMASFFAALVTGEIRQGTRLLPVVVAAVTAVLAMQVLEVGWSIVVAAIGGGLTGAWLRVR
ncbi:MAG: AzlC family ABC transporter permease [Pseudomonadota bacterium]